MKQIPSLFYAGNYAAIIDEFENHKGLVTDHHSFVVGAYCFLGRLLDAEGLNLRFSEEMSIDCRVRSNYFLAISYTRQLKIKEARRKLIANVVIARLKTSNIALHYALLGLTFKHYSYGRYMLAKFYGQKAFRLSTSQLDDYAKLLSSDLLGHCFCALGEYDAGCEYFSIAEAISKQFGAGAVSQAIVLTKALYRSTYGIERQGNIALLVLSESLEYKDSYSSAHLKMEIVRNFLLMGKLDEAALLLENSRSEIFNLENLRLQLLHQLRLAELYYLSGRLDNSLSIIIQSLQRLQTEGYDKELKLKMSFLGMKIKIAKLRGIEPREDVTMLRSLTTLSGGILPVRIWSREENPLSPSRFMRGVDPLGDLLDDVAHRTIGLPEILNSPYHGLLAKFFDIPLGSTCLVFDYDVHGLIVLHRGNTKYLRTSSLSKMQWAFLELLGQGPKSIESIIKKLWETQSVASRHGVLLSSFVSRLLQKMNLHESNIVIKDGMMSFAPHLLLRNLNKHTLPSESSPPNEQPGLLDLNYRQRSFLKSQQNSIGKEFDTGQYQRVCEVSPSTATRDLRDMVAKCLLKTSGRGKAVRYHINANTPPTGPNNHA